MDQLDLQKKSEKYNSFIAVLHLWVISDECDLYLKLVPNNS
jgi:hypothetical protein